MKQHIPGKCSIDVRIERDQAKGKVTSEKALMFVGNTCPCSDCHERRSRWRTDRLSKVRP